MLSVLACPAVAEPECHPVTPEAIAKTWSDFASQSGVRPNSGSDRYECLTLDAARTTACRTTPANPAHPSIILRTVVRQHGGWFVQTKAGTAASCEAFLAMLREFDAVTDQVRETLERQRAAQPPR
jgi:hypothetical protein